MELTPEELKARLDRKDPVFLLDVRQPWEFELARIEGATLLPLNELPARAQELAPPEGALVVTVCHHGMRSLQAAYFLRQAGFPEALSLRGGIDAWSERVDAGVPRY